MKRRDFFKVLAGAVALLAAPKRLWATPQVKPLPKKWVLCDGRYLARADYPELFNILKGKFGGFKEYWGDEEIEFFRVPDMRARVMPINDAFHDHSSYACAGLTVITQNNYIKVLPDSGDDLWSVGSIILHTRDDL